jgi:hypothetical protein
MRKVWAVVFSGISAIEDVSAMTGFTRNTLKSIENCGERNVRIQERGKANP